MAITLHPDQEVWLQTRVANGDFASIEAAARQLIDSQIIQQRELEADDVSWAKSLVDEAMAAFERGEFITLDEHKARNRRRFEVLKR